MGIGIPMGLLIAGGYRRAADWYSQKDHFSEVRPIVVHLERWYNFIVKKDFMIFFPDEGKLWNG